MKKSSKFCAFAALTGCFLIAAAATMFVGCGDDAQSGGTIKAVDFTDKSITVEIGDSYYPDIITAKDEAGNTYTLNENLFITVKNSEGTDVPSSKGEFVVEDFGGYTVYYNLYEGKNRAERKVNISVSDKTAPLIDIAGWRSEREAGTFDMPIMYVSDNSGEHIEPSYRLVSSDTLASTSAAVIDNGKVRFTQTGNYTLIVEATDSHGNSSQQEKNIKIIDTLGDYVLENFDNETRLETIKTTSIATASTTAEWLESFEGKSGVAKINANYSLLYTNNNCLQLSFSKTKDEMLEYNWDYILVKMYIETDVATVSIGNGTTANMFGTCETNRWVEIKLTKKAYLSHLNKAILPNFDGTETLEDRYLAFATAVTGDTPAIFLSAAPSNRNKIITFYIDEVLWGLEEPDTVGPEITLLNGDVQVLSNSTMPLSMISVSDDRDPITFYDSVKFFKITDSGDEQLNINGTYLQFREEGLYKLVVTASDFSGNETVKTFEFEALDVIDHISKTITTGTYFDSSYNDSNGWNIVNVSNWNNSDKAISFEYKNNTGNAFEYFYFAGYAGTTRVTRQVTIVVSDSSYGQANTIYGGAVGTITELGKGWYRFFANFKDISIYTNNGSNGTETITKIEFGAIGGNSLSVNSINTAEDFQYAPVRLNAGATLSSGWNIKPVENWKTSGKALSFDYKDVSGNGFIITGYSDSAAITRQININNTHVIDFFNDDGSTKNQAVVSNLGDGWYHVVINYSDLGVSSGNPANGEATLVKLYCTGVGTNEIYINNVNTLADAIV